MPQSFRMYAEKMHFFAAAIAAAKKCMKQTRMYAEKKHFFAAAIAAAKKCKKQTRMNAEQRILNAERRIMNACSKVRFYERYGTGQGEFVVQKPTRR